MSEWKLRYYRDGDEQGILDCLTAAFGTWPAIDINATPLEHLRWKLSSDSQGRHFSFIAEVEGEIVGCQLIVVQRLKDGERSLLANTCTDYAVHPEWQGRGVSRDLWDFDPREFASTFDLLINITDSRTVKHQISTIGWSKALANTIGWVECDLASAPQRRPNVLKITTVQHFDREIDELCLKALFDFELCIIRDVAYLNWRFADTRAGTYTIRVMHERDELAGYSVLTVLRGRGVIADLLVLPGRPDLVEALAGDALEYFARLGLGAARTWMPERHAYREALLHSGFRPLRPIAYLGLGPHRGAPMPLRDDPNAAVYYMPGDTDIV